MQIEDFEHGYWEQSLADTFEGPFEKECPERLCDRYEDYDFVVKTERDRLRFKKVRQKKSPLNKNRTLLRRNQCK